MKFKTGLPVATPATIHPKIERTPKGELIVVFKDGALAFYHYEWLLTASKEHLERVKRLTQPNA